MLSIRWETLVVAVIICLMALALTLQIALRTNLARLVQTFLAARRSATDEPNLGDSLGARRITRKPFISRRSRVS